MDAHSRRRCDHRSSAYVDHLLEQIRSSLNTIERSAKPSYRSNRSKLFLSARAVHSVVLVGDEAQLRAAIENAPNALLRRVALSF
jgi:hypothetical protein